MLDLRIQHDLLECGTDEAGRGCLAGPVTAAAVILPDDFYDPLLTDSKQLNEKQREQLRAIVEKEAISWAVTHVMMDEIDQLNILKASITAMQRSILRLDPKPEYIAVDGNRFYTLDGYQHQCVIKGDGKYLNIAAASILAKTHRDSFMQKIDLEFPAYGWKQNKGYPTKAHRAAIWAHGITPYHRRSFQLLPKQLELAL